MLDLVNVSRVYRTDEVATAALQSIDLRIEAADFVAIMGPSGCGKSTLLNILGAIDRPTHGQYLFDGQDLARLNDKALARLRGEHLGFVFQSFNLIDELTVRENVELGVLYRRMGGAERRAKVEAALDRVGVAHLAARYPHQLSGGQQQRAAIARAVVGRPSTILADEPTGNLDSEAGAQIMGVLQGLNADGVTVVLATHSPSHADWAKRRVDMIDGRIATSARRAM